MTDSTLVQRFIVTIERYPEGHQPTSEDVMLAVQDALAPGGRLHGIEVYSVEAADA